MARLEGAEFGLDPARLRSRRGLRGARPRPARATPRGQTASAGVARWDGEEPADLLIARCMDALAAAKAAGRDMTIPAD